MILFLPYDAVSLRSGKVSLAVVLYWGSLERKDHFLTASGSKMAFGELVDGGSWSFLFIFDQDFYLFLRGLLAVVMRPSLHLLKMLARPQE